MNPTCWLAVTSTTLQIWRWLRLSATTSSLALALGGCTAVATEPGGAPWQLTLTTEDGAPLERYAVSVAAAGALIAEADCPLWASGGLECTAAGATLHEPPERPIVTVKAPGYHFVTTALADSAPEAVPTAPRSRSVTLSRVPVFTDVDDYVTGFDADSGQERFRALALDVDTELGPTQLVKWYLRLQAEAPEVYFQNTRVHPLHYDFARNVLGVDLSRAEFEASTYVGADRTGLAGVLTHYPQVSAPSAAFGGTTTAPYVVTFFPSDDVTPAQARLATRAIEERLGFAAQVGKDRRIAYQPAGEVQEAELALEVGGFAEAAVGYVTQRELHGEQRLQILNPGLAYGTLRRLSPAELERSVVSARDLLVLTRLPSSLPVVAGTITEELQTPLAHVNVAARTRGTPNLAWIDAGVDPRVTGLLGELVRFEVTAGGFTLDPTTLDEASAFWAAQHPAGLVPTFDAARDGLPDFEELGFADVVTVGAKAANLAELRHLLGELVPPGFAVPFHYYDAFLSTTEVTPAACAAAESACVATGRTTTACAAAASLCGALPESGREPLLAHTERLLGDAGFQSDTALRDAALALLRHHIQHGTVDPAFAAALDARVAALVGSGKARLRSSTNTEDLPSFSGAGLYQSVSAEASGSTAASARIREVWASVWSWAAYEERAFWGIDHHAVRMACAVNPAQPDEAANGVLVTRNLASPMVDGMYVNVQLGEVSVTNPEGGALPEIFSIIPSPTGIQVARQRFSSLNPETPLLSEAEVRALFLAADQVQQHFAALYDQHPTTLALELEFKLIAPDRALVIKQVRPFVAG